MKAVQLLQDGALGLPVQDLPAPEAAERSGREEALAAVAIPLLGVLLLSLA